MFVPACLNPRARWMIYFMIYKSFALNLLDVKVFVLYQHASQIVLSSYYRGTMLTFLKTNKPMVCMKAGVKWPFQFYESTTNLELYNLTIEDTINIYSHNLVITT